MYQIIDMHTKQVVAKAETLKQATRKCDMLDRKYGAVRFIKQWVV